jgi:hypothetical protein
MRVVWNVGVCLAGAVAVALIVVGATYLSVDAGSLPTALGRVAGSTAHRNERGFFAVMVGGLVVLVTILASQFRPGGALALKSGDTVEATDHLTRGDAEPRDADGPATTE